jgi:response regulator NasT
MQVDLKLPVSRRVVIVEENGSRGQMLGSLLAKQGASAVATIADPGQLLDAVTRHRPDAVIISMGSPTARLLGEVERLRESGGCPVVLLSQDISPDKLRAAVDAGVNAVVFVGLNANNLTSAIGLAVADFHRNETLRTRAADAERALRERKIIERAKGTVMKQRNVEESVAYNLMRRRAMAQGKRLVEVAAMINEAAEMLMDT